MLSGLVQATVIALVGTLLSVVTLFKGMWLHAAILICVTAATSCIFFNLKKKGHHRIAWSALTLAAAGMIATAKLLPAAIT